MPTLAVAGNFTHPHSTEARPPGAARDDGARRVKKNLSRNKRKKPEGRNGEPSEMVSQKW
jgi:hypothetical protein